MAQLSQTPRRPGPLRPSFGNSIGLRQPTSNNKDFGPPSPADGYSRDRVYKPTLSALTPDDFSMSRQFSGAPAGYDQENGVVVGDTVEVPGGMFGTVRYIGSVRGKAGVFAGVELEDEFAARGKNDGDVEGVSYFVTAIAGSGIFLPAFRAVKQNVTARTPNAQPTTPTNPSYFDLNRTPAAKSRSPVTPSVPKFSQSVQIGARHPFSQSVSLAGRPSPAIKPKTSRPSLPRPESPTRRPPLPSGHSSTSGRPSLGFNSSVRGGRPPVASSPAPKKFTAAQPVTPARPASRSQSRLADHQDTPTVSRTLNGLRTQPKVMVAPSVEVRRLQQELVERDKQLQLQASALADMEASLAEMQSAQPSATIPGGEDAAELAQLRAALREKNEKISMLTAEFDQHRSDFRSTIDTLEMASTETEKVYEKRVEELQTEVREQQREIVDLQENAGNVEMFAEQFKQLEELVMELEEGLEHARRGEAEARGEVEHLRGEVERTKSELQHERTLVVSTPAADIAQMQQKEEEIRALRETISNMTSNEREDEQVAERHNKEVAALKGNLETLSGQNTELKQHLDTKAARERELEKALERLRQETTTSTGIKTPQDARPTSPVRRPAPVMTSNNSPNLPTNAASPMRFGLGLGLGGMRTGMRGIETSSPRPDSATFSSPSRARADSHDKHCDICHEDTHDTDNCYHEGSYMDDIDDDHAVNYSRDGPPTPDLLPVHDGEPVYDPAGTGPAPGKSTRRIDMTKWCALCERDGHESVDCPFEEEW